mmetsp:Transcript_29650/g.69710  ORF Transcript_29650/g.69710 Transcript_29650/m.69710 type:complete len:159 (-) Transcript_29650:1491-1967(-)
MGVFIGESSHDYLNLNRETVNMGKTKLSMSEVRSLIDELGSDFPGNSYHIVTRNCNSFCDELCMRLVGKHIPPYINRLAYVGSFFSCLLPPSLLRGPSPAPTSELGSRTAASPPRTVEAFKGQGHALADRPVEQPADPEQMRSRMAQAALRRLQPEGE